MSDTDLESDGTITLTLLANNTPTIAYTVASSPDDSAEIAIYDDDSPPTVWISADSGEYPEGPTEAPFEVSATGMTGTTLLYINATPTEMGSDFLQNSRQDDAQVYEVTFEDSDGDSTFTGELAEPLHNDGVGEATGNIKMTLNAEQGATPTYRLGTITEGVLTIWDDDAPELEITAGDPVTEAVGAMANFTVTAKVIPSAPINVKYTLTETQDFIATADKTPPLSKPLDFNNTKSATFPVAIVNDTAFEEHGTVTVTLTADTATPIKYTLPAASSNTATMNIINDDVPELSVAVESTNSTIVEGDNVTANFMISTDVSPNKEITVRYNLAETSDLLLKKGLAKKPP